jgi:hypothetical protein
MGRVEQPEISPPTREEPIPGIGHNSQEFEAIRYVTMQVASQISGLSRTTLYRESMAGRLTTRKVAGRALVRLSSLKKLIEDSPPAVLRRSR